MAKKVPPLSDTKIKNAKPKKTSYKLSDGDGLYLFVTKSGGKFWRLKYISPLTQKEKVFSIGKYPDITLAEAREQRLQLRQKIASGIDPSQEKKENKTKRKITETRDSMTFSQVAEELLQHKRNISDSYRDMQRRRLIRHVYPAIGDTPISAITRVDIITVIKKIEAQKTYEMSQRVFSLCHEIFRYAAANELIPYNLLQDIDKKSVFIRQAPNHHPVLLDPAEIKALLIAMDNYYGDISTQFALRLLPHLAVRPGTLQVAEWNEIDWEKRIWTIPGEKMKGDVTFKGTNIQQPHLVPLSRQVVEILRELQRHTRDSPYLFPGMTSRQNPISENTLSRAMKRLGYQGRMRPHSFRALFSTILHNTIVEHGFHSEIIERQLAHKETNKVKEAYNHAEYLPQRIKMMQWWSDHLDQLRDS